MGMLNGFAFLMNKEAKVFNFLSIFLKFRILKNVLPQVSWIKIKIVFFYLLINK